MDIPSSNVQENTSSTEEKEPINQNPMEEDNLQNYTQAPPPNEENEGDKKENVPSSDQDENQKEVKQFYKLNQYFKSHKEDLENFYIIHSDWIHEWKKVTGYKEICKMEVNFTRQGKINPIDNSSFIIPKKDYLQEKNETDMIIDSNSFVNVKPLSKDMWDFFVSRYGGGPEISIKLKKKFYNEFEIDIYFIKVNFVILPSKEKFKNSNVLDELKQYTTYISRNKSFKDLEVHIKNVIYDNNILKRPEVEIKEENKSEEKKEEEHKEEDKKEENKEEDKKEEETKEKIEEDKKDDVEMKTNEKPQNEPETDPIKIWKVEQISSLEELKAQIETHSIDLTETPIDTATISEMHCIDSYNKYKIADLTPISNQSSLPTFFFMIEQTPYIFQQKKEELKYGSCEYCRKDKLLSIPCKCKEVWYCDEQCLKRDIRFHQNNCKADFEIADENLERSEFSCDGLVGLSNLGNTCFMNTSLQCLSNCYELTKYFLTKTYLKHINVKNPIGTKGILARAYGNLLKHLWYGTNSSYSPMEFKQALGTFQKMFTGYRQHDTQEFLNYLLDGLHEDLNKVLDKPAITKDESKGSDSIKSHNSWIDFLRRNQSVLVELFYGQFKSTLICPNAECKNISIIFEPFLSISLPLKAKPKSFSVKCFFIFHNLRVKPILLSYLFFKSTNIMALRNKVAKTLNIHPFSFLVAQLESSDKIEGFFTPNQILRSYSYRDEKLKFFLFQIDPAIFYSPYNSLVPESEYNEGTRNFLDISDTIKAKKDIFIQMNRDDYVEEENVPTDNDFGHLGFNLEKTVRVMIHIYNEETGDRIIFPRCLYLLLDDSIPKVYFYLFKYFLNIILMNRKVNEEEGAVYFENGKNEEAIKKLYEELFSEMTKELSIDENVDFNQTKIPFRLRLCATEREKYTYSIREKKIGCHKLIPFDENLTLREVVKKFKEVREKECFRNLDEEEFSCVLSWNPSYKQCLEKLNSYDSLPELGLESLNFDSPCQIDIYDCFKSFVKEEILEEHNEWYCSKCKQHQRASKKIDIYKAPNILIIHLKRFTNNSKIDTVVNFPIKGLNISDYVVDKKEGEEYKYDLFAIANHYGSMGFGHYVAFAKNHFKQNWYEFNDSSVSQRNESELIGSSAYVLFYRKQGTENQDYSSVYEREFVEYVNAYMKDDQNEKMEVDEEHKKDQTPEGTS